MQLAVGRLHGSSLAAHVDNTSSSLVCGISSHVQYARNAFIQSVGFSTKIQQSVCSCVHWHIERSHSQSVWCPIVTAFPCLFTVICFLSQMHCTDWDCKCSQLLNCCLTSCTLGSKGHRLRGHRWCTNDKVLASGEVLFWGPMEKLSTVLFIHPLIDKLCTGSRLN